MIVDDGAKDKSRRKEIYITQAKSATGSLASKMSSCRRIAAPIEEAKMIEDEVSPTFRKEVLKTKVITAYPRSLSHYLLPSTFI